MSFFKYSNVPWHWQLAHKYGPLYNFDNTTTRTYDICTYVKAVGRGLLTVLMLTIAGGMVGAVVGSFGAWVLATAMTMSYINPTLLTVVGISAIVGVGASYVILTVIDWLEVAVEAYDNWRAGRSINKRIERANQPFVEVEKEPGFIELWYRSIKDKACIDITVRTSHRE